MNTKVNPIGYLSVRVCHLIEAIRNVGCGYSSRLLFYRHKCVTDHKASRTYSLLSASWSGIPAQNYFHFFVIFDVQGHFSDFQSNFLNAGVHRCISFGLLILALYQFFLRCMHCMQRCLSMRKLSVRLSARLSNVCIVTKRKKLAPRLVYRMEDHYLSHSYSI